MKREVVMRVARPTDRLNTIARMYQAGLGLEVLGQFLNHRGFDGVILGHPSSPYHLEFTSQQGHVAGAAPTLDNLLVFYISDRAEWLAACERMTAAGFRRVTSANPFWDERGRTFEDPDGYRIVLENSAWDVSAGRIGSVQAPSSRANV